MRKIFMLSLLALLIISLGACAAERGPVVNQALQPEQDSSAPPAEAELSPAPELVFTDAEGNEVSLADLAGQPVVVNFWATWCGPCVSELTAFDNLAAKYGEQVAFVMLNMTDGKDETVTKVNQFIAEQGYRFPVYYDYGVKASAAAGIVGYPTTWLVDSEGMLVKSVLGAKTEEQWEEYILSLLNE